MNPGLNTFPPTVVVILTIQLMHCQPLIADKITNFKVLLCLDVKKVKFNNNIYIKNDFFFLRSVFISDKWASAAAKVGLHICRVSGSMVYLIRFCFLFSNFLGGVTRTHCGLRFDHVLRTLAAAAVLHGIAGLFVEDDAEEEDERALEGGEQVGERVSKTKDLATRPKLLH